MFKILLKSISTGRVTENKHNRENAKSSCHIRHVDTGSCNGCDWEMTALLNPVYDIQHLGFDFVASPRHADILLVTGCPTKHLETALVKTYEATPSPKVVVALGDCAIDGGEFKDSYAVHNGVHTLVPVDVTIPGCPPTPDEIIEGLQKASNIFQEKLRQKKAAK